VNWPKAILLLLIPFILFNNSCNSGLFDTRISQGTIEFEVTYPDLDPDDMLAGLMPDKMNMKFKDNVFNSELSAGMGMFKTNFISNSNDYKLVNSVKLINKKYATELDKDGVKKANKKFENVSIIKMEETKMIAGFNCKKALVVFENIDANDMYVYYTDEIKFEDPNWSTPFKDINGMLLEYTMEKFDIRMKFTATNVAKAELEESDFTLPEDYEMIPHEDLEKEINSIFETFQ